MRYQSLILRVLLGLGSILSGCEKDTKLTVRGSNPPEFALSGNGSVRAVRVYGPGRQREIEGPDASAYWYIKAEEGGAVDADEIGAITYGRVPDGYRQVYPERGAAVPLVEGERYLIRVSTANANGAGSSFRILGGVAKVE